MSTTATAPVYTLTRLAPMPRHERATDEQTAAYEASKTARAADIETLLRTLFTHPDWEVQLPPKDSWSTEPFIRLTRIGHSFRIKWVRPRYDWIGGRNSHFLQLTYDPRHGSKTMRRLKLTISDDKLTETIDKAKADKAATEIITAYTQAVDWEEKTNAAQDKRDDLNRAAFAVLKAQLLKSGITFDEVDPDETGGAIHVSRYGSDAVISVTGDKAVLARYHQSVVDIRTDLIPEFVALFNRNKVDVSAPVSE